MTRAIRVSVHIAHELAAEIKTGQMPEGSRLPSERSLVTRFGASRMSVREALLSLQSAGLIVVQDRTRAIVRKPSAQSLLHPLAGAVQSLLATPGGMLDFQEARILFECGLARHAASFASPKDIERLADRLAANRRAIGMLDQFIATDMAFHLILAEIPQNGIFVALSHALAGWLADQRRIGMGARGAVRRAYAHHEAIFAAVQSRSPEQADRAMAEHLRFVAQTYRDQSDAAVA